MLTWSKKTNLTSTVSTLGEHLSNIINISSLQQCHKHCTEVKQWTLKPQTKSTLTGRQADRQHQGLWQQMTQVSYRQAKFRGCSRFHLILWKCHSDRLCVLLDLQEVDLETYQYTTAQKQHRSVCAYN